jgi:hypothetical protein
MREFFKHTLTPIYYFLFKVRKNKKHPGCPKHKMGVVEIYGKN